uniref:Uncharacterized protein n=1 Tax=Glossina pallidipes TaxID=7398 RepID=A0A1A9ZL88_GLOPL
MQFKLAAETKITAKRRTLFHIAMGSEGVSNPMNSLMVCEYVIVLVFSVSSSFLTAAFLSISSSLDVVSSQSASFSTRRGFPVCILRPPMVPLRDARAKKGLTDDLRLAANLADTLEDPVDGLATCLTDDLTAVLTDALEAGLVDALDVVREIKALEGALTEGLIVALNMYKRSGLFCISSKSGNLNVNTNHGFSGSTLSSNAPVSVDIASALACSSLIEYRIERLLGKRRFSVNHLRICHIPGQNLLLVAIPRYDAFYLLWQRFEMLF